MFTVAPEEAKPEAKDKEELLGGAVALKPYEGKGFEINLPLIFRTLRKRLARPNQLPEETDPKALPEN